MQVVAKRHGLTAVLSEVVVGGGRGAGARLDDGNPKSPRAPRGALRKKTTFVYSTPSTAETKSRDGPEEEEAGKPGGVATGRRPRKHREGRAHPRSFLEQLRQGRRGKTVPVHHPGSLGAAQLHQRSTEPGSVLCRERDWGAVLDQVPCPVPRLLVQHVSAPGGGGRRRCCNPSPIGAGQIGRLSLSVSAVW